MRKIAYSFVASALIFGACNETQFNDEATLDVAQSSLAYSRACASHDVLTSQISADPKLQSRIDAIESFTEKSIANGTVARLAADGVIEIPVVVHVLYRLQSENISLAQIQSQIDVLNEDFNATNADISLVPNEFSGVTADVGLRFVLEGVTRTSTRVRRWGTNDAMKFGDGKKDKGVSAWDTQQYLNIWVVGDMGGILGYAQFPGGDPATDGVVVAHNYFGRTGRVSAPFDKGRTTTHEVGHWLNLRHIWGDGGCGASDFVADTPDSDGPNYSCPSYPSVACGTTDMTMNYMDYTDDGCMYMFSQGQKNRMLAVFAAGGPRAAMGQ